MFPERKIRLAYVVAQSVRWASFEWLCRALNRDRFDLSFIFLKEGPLPVASFLEACSIQYLHLPFTGKTNLPWAMRGVARFCCSNRIDIVHTHFMNACLARLPGAYLAGVPIRIHTRHHAGPLSWTHRAPWGRFYDRFNNALSSDELLGPVEARPAA